MAGRKPKSRTNRERTAETKAKLLDAAERCLIDVGYAKTTNMEVCRRSGVSNGSLLYHFRTRENLLASALDRLYERLRQQVITELSEPQPSSDRLDRLVDALWSVFDSDEFKVVVELWVAAANDKGLRRRVLPVMKEFSESIEPTAARLLPDAAEGSPHFSDTVSILVYLLQGMGLARSTFGPERDTSGTRRRVKEMLRWALEKR